MADDDAQQDAQQDPQDSTTAPQDAPATDALGDPGKAALAQERKARQDAERARKVAERELEGYRAAAMSDTERAIAEAKNSTRAEVMAQLGTRLARTEFVAEAARRNATYDAKAVVDDLNLAKYVGEDGEPDLKAISKAVERLIPAPAAAPSFDGGARTSASRPMTGNEFLRDAFQRARG